MKALVVGCGYVGERLADLLHAAGHDVVGLTHSADSARRLAAIKPYDVRSGDVSDPAVMRRLALAPEVVIHCASSGRGGAESYQKVYADGCRNLAETFPGARLVLCSSTSVYPQVDGSWVTEESEATPERPTSRLLREAEDGVLSGNGCVARLAGIYGPERSFVLRNFLEGTAAIESHDGEGRWLNQIHREDAARALAHLAISAVAHEVFNVADDTPMTQRQCFAELSARFGRPLPPTTDPDIGRKRAWTSKRVSNSKLRATGWAPLFPSYFNALDEDSQLVPSILQQVRSTTEARSATTNVVLIGLMGSGKSTVGRIAAQLLGFEFVDTDQVIVEAAGKSIPAIFAAESEEGFRARETAALQSLLRRHRLVIATGGGIVTRAENLPVLRQLGFVVWLDAGVETLWRRVAHSQDRPLLRDADPLQKLRSLHEERSPMYQRVSELKISTDDLSLQDAAYGLAESVRVHFSSRE